MDEGQALLRAIREAPEDDALRLVYSDWLEEHGRPEHAEFIRRHIDWCRRDPDAPPDADASARLVAAWEASGLAERKLPEGALHVYDRGFIAGVRFDGQKQTRREMEAILRDEPIRVAWFYPAEKVEAPLVKSPLLACLIGLCCTGWSDVDGRLLHAPHLSRLSLLSLNGPHWASEPVAARLVATAPHLDSLDVLDLDWTHTGDEGLALLSGASHLRTVQKITVGGDGGGSYRIGEEGIRALAASETFQQLSHLGFAGCDLSEARFRHLLTWGGARRLLSLDLSGTSLPAAEVAALARSNTLGRLQRLDLSYCGLDDEAVRALASPETLPGLRRLQIEDESWSRPVEDIDPDLLTRTREKFADRLTMTPMPGHTSILGQVGEADRIWQRLRRVTGSSS